MKPSMTFVSLCLFLLFFTGCTQAAPSATVLPAATARLSATPFPILETATDPPAPTSRPTATVLLATLQPTQSFLAMFPIQPGTTWVYSSTHYAQAGSDPEKILQKTMKIEERIVDAQSVSSDTILHIQGSQTILSTDPGWNETGMAEDNGGIMNTGT